MCPLQILSYLLSHCDEQTLHIAIRTCRRWHCVNRFILNFEKIELIEFISLCMIPMQVINETIGFNIAIGKPYMTLYRKPRVPFQSISVIERLGVKHCYVGDLTDVQGCSFAYPQTVRSIVFDGPITQFNLKTLLEPLPALTHLTIHYTALENIRLDRISLNTATLKSIRIASHGIGDEYDRSRAVDVLDTIISLLLRINSLKLSVLILDVIHIPFYDRKVTRAVLTLMLRHKYTMRNVQFYNFTERLEPAPPGTEDESDTDFIKEPIVRKAIQEVVHLNRISFGGKRRMSSEDAWNELIQSQKSLREMFYMSDKRDMYSTCIPCLSRNSATLQKTLFHISGVDDARNVVKFDCKVLKNFQKLSHLLIRGRKAIFPFAHDVDGEIAVARISVKLPVLSNIEYIPNQVTVFSMRDICVETESLKKFTDNNFLPNLLKFRLVDCGSLGGFGITPDTLTELMKREKLREIEIINSFSMLHWDNANGKDIYEDAVFFKVSHHK